MYLWWLSQYLPKLPEYILMQNLHNFSLRNIIFHYIRTPSIYVSMMIMAIFARNSLNIQTDKHPYHEEHIKLEYQIVQKLSENLCCCLRFVYFK